MAHTYRGQNASSRISPSLSDKGKGTAYLRICASRVSSTRAKLVRFVRLVAQREARSVCMRIVEVDRQAECLAKKSAVYRRSGVLS